MLRERFCQDSLESFFGKQRYQGGYGDNPPMKKFLDNTVSLRVQGSAAHELLRGNYTRKRNLTPTVDDTPLPKRKRIMQSIKRNEQRTVNNYDAVE